MVALYLRKSTEDDVRGGCSESIANQRLFLEEYCRAKGYFPTKVYADDGFSGTNFDRPAFRELLDDIENGLVDTVITKDFSRLGRNYILAGQYLEEYFPLHNVRYIAVNDCIDTFSDDGLDITPIRAVFNDFYARDISIKVRTALSAKKKNGRFVAARAPYGYRKSPYDKNLLVPDAETAPTVRTIFFLALQGVTPSEIAGKLTALNVPSPTGKSAWNGTTVRNILASETYIGNLVQGKRRRTSYKIKKMRSVPQKDWICSESTHEPLVSAKDFMTVKKLISVRQPKKKTSEAVLSGLCFCGSCGAVMYRHSSGGNHYLVCSHWKKHGGCSSHSVREDTVLSEICDFLREYTSGISPEDIIPTERKIPDTEALSARYRERLYRLYLDR